MNFISRLSIKLHVLFFFGEFELDTTSNSTGSSGGDQTNLSTSGLPSGNSCWLTDVLMVTTTMRMFNRIHTNTSDLREHLSLALEHVMFLSGLQNWLFVSATTSDNTNHASGNTLDSFFVTTWKLDSGLGTVFGLTDNGNEGTGGSGKSTTIVMILFDVAHGGTFWDSVNWQNVSGGDLGLGTGVDVLANVHRLASDEVFGVLFVLVWVGELNLSEWGTSTWIVDQILDDSLDVSATFDIIANSELAWGNSVECV